MSKSLSKSLSKSFKTFTPIEVKSIISNLPKGEQEILQKK